ncbi:hypothetical protein SAMN04488003_101142 [Loktanella fryxellensis]|uniref:Uncharacterized protein n=1 Tax=Loktanella fryxellensis TaxID=245187 RepID=A0A1H7YEA7_9RHOB|nr:hypothetical protein [Loktanella fryxellensis]SEM44566.1 hypothetical protein SAMN04488003_101142 [Loktanella fryxellensis]
MTLPSADPVHARGGAPVGQLDELPPLEMIAILFMRMWCDGGTNRQRITQDMALALGQTDADAATALFDDLMRLTLGCARRPLVRHGVPCRCFGGDECAFANMLVAATTGDRDEAMLFSSILVTGQAAFPAIALAQDLSPYLLRFARATQATMTPAAPQATHPAQTAIRH